MKQKKKKNTLRQEKTAKWYKIVFVIIITLYRSNSPNKAEGFRINKNITYLYTVSESI